MQPQISVEIDNGILGYQPKEVIYRGKVFKAPVYLTTLLAYDYLINVLLLKSKEKDIYHS
jgi:hypothetical protein